MASKKEPAEMDLQEKTDDDICCLTLPLKLEKWQEDRLTKRFRIARQIYNTLVSFELKKLHRVEQLPEYKKIMAEMKGLDSHKADDKKVLTRLYRERRKFLKDKGFDKFSFKKDIEKCYKHFSENVGSSVAVHCIAERVWKAFDKVLFGKGKKVRFKKYDELRSLEGASDSKRSGGKEIMFKDKTHEKRRKKHKTSDQYRYYVAWKDLELPVKVSQNNAYEAEMLTCHIKRVRILCKPGKTKDRWYAQLILDGKPAIKRDLASRNPVHSVGHGAVGLDIGPQTLAYSARTEVALVELADQVQNIEQKKCRLQRKMERSRRATNPDNYDKENGTIRKSVKLTHNKSKRYRKLQLQLRYIQHCQAETRKRQHTALANHLLTLGDCFFVEDMKWMSLTRRAKKTEKSEKTGRYKCKKRYGASVANKAPATLIQILTQKCRARNIPGVVKLPTSLRASQYNHLTQGYVKKGLSKRWNYMPPDGKPIQRDLYSAFLLQHYNPQLENFDQEALERDYPQFVRLHDPAIERLKNLPHTPSSMGIRRLVS